MMMVVKEPLKSAVLAYAPGTPIARHSFSVILDRRGNRTFEAVVDVNGGKVISWNQIKGVQPLVLAGEYEALSTLVKADPRWQDAMRNAASPTSRRFRSTTGPWVRSHGGFKGRRLLRALSYFKGDATNFYGRPIEGVVALVDMNADQVVEFVDTGVVPLPPASQELDEKSTGVRTAPKPLAIAQPDGASFEINGQEVRWQKWRFRYAMHPREGLVLHTVGYEDEGRLRPILYRAIAVGDGRAVRRPRSATGGGAAPSTSASTASAGWPARSSRRPTHPRTRRSSTPTFAGDDGVPYVLPRARRHLRARRRPAVEALRGRTPTTNESRRARELVIFFIATIGNYDYARQLGLPPGRRPRGRRGALPASCCRRACAKRPRTDTRRTGPSGHLVAANVVAPHHQHFFNFRLDFDVDGPKNVVHEMNTRARPPGRTIPHSTASSWRRRCSRTETAAQRDMNMAAARTWQVLNPAERRTRSATTRATSSFPAATRSRTSRRRHRCAGAPASSTTTSGRRATTRTRCTPPVRIRIRAPAATVCRAWAANNESLVNQDVVVWYTLGITHIPRPEEWPVMPVTHVGFKMIPGGFFTRNPALDVPR